MRHLTWRGFETHLAYLMMAFNILVQWDGLEPYQTGSIHRSISPLTPTSSNGFIDRLLSFPPSLPSNL